MPGDTSRANGKKGGRPRRPRAARPLEVPPLPTGDPRLETLGLQVVQPADDLPFTLTPNQFGLTGPEELFVIAYLQEANAAAAYRTAHPRCSEATSHTNGPAVLRKTHVAAAVREGRRLQFIHAQMSGEEAMALLANIARGDIGEILGPHDPISKLPLQVRRRIKTVRPGPYGRVIELYPAPAAMEFIAKATGAAKETIRIESSLEDIMAHANRLLEAAAGAAR